MERNEFKLSFKQQLEAITREANGTVEQILRTDEYFIDKTKIGIGSFPVNQNQTRTVLLYVLKKIIREKLDDEELNDFKKVYKYLEK
jgi:hypothetical protein